MRGRPGLEAAARSKPQGLTPPQRRCARPVHPAATTSASRPSPGAPQPQCAASSANGTRKKTVPAPPSRQRTVEGGGSVQKGQPAGRAERGGTATSSRRQPPARPRLPHTAPKGRAVDLAARRRRVGRRSVPVGRVAPPLPIVGKACNLNRNGPHAGYGSHAMPHMTFEIMPIASGMGFWSSRDCSLSTGWPRKTLAQNTRDALLSSCVK